MFSPTTETTNERMSPKKQGQGSSTLDEKPWTKDCGILSLSLSLSLSLLSYLSLYIYIYLSLCVRLSCFHTQAQKQRLGKWEPCLHMRKGSESRGKKCARC